MNLSVYLFGILDSGYVQYPYEESFATVFKKMGEEATAPSQIVIHRERALMYYGYVRKLKNNRYIGLCALLNELMLTDFNGMFHAFEEIISNMAEKGYYIHFDRYGDLEACSSKAVDAEALENVSELLDMRFEMLADSAEQLPAVNYGIAGSSVKKYSIIDNHAEILKSSHENGYTYVFKSEGYDTPRMESYRQVLASSARENDELKKQNVLLKSENARILRQKKQIQYVVALVVLLLLCGLMMISLNKNLNNTQQQLEQTEKDLKFMTDEADRKSNTIASLQVDLSNERVQRQTVESTLDSLNQIVGEHLPILINNVLIGNKGSNSNMIDDFGTVIYSSGTEYLCPKIIYWGIRGGDDIELSVKLYDRFGNMSKGSSSPADCSYTSSLHVESGSGEAELSGWGSARTGHWESGNYRIEIWYGNMCLFQKKFVIY